jgi:hypothetical protein
LFLNDPRTANLDSQQEEIFVKVKSRTMEGKTLLSTHAQEKEATSFDLDGRNGLKYKG